MTFPLRNKNNRWQVWSGMREEYHYVSLTFPTVSPSSAAAAQSNMPVHITFKKLRDRNCNLTVERSCTMYTVPRGRHTLTDEQRCTCLSAASTQSASHSLPCSDLALAPSCTCLNDTLTHTHTHTHTLTHMTLQPTQWSICTLHLNVSRRYLTFALRASPKFSISFEPNWSPTLTGWIQGLPTDLQGLLWENWRTLHFHIFGERQGTA